MKKTKDRGVFMKVPELERPLTKKQLTEMDDIDNYVKGVLKPLIPVQFTFPSPKMKKGARIKALETRVERLQTQVSTLSRVVREMIEREERKKRR